MSTRTLSLPLCVGLAIVGPATAHAEPADPPARPWTNTTELGFVMTSGNSEAQSLNLGNKYAYTWADAQFTLDALALRTETTTKTPINTDGVVTVLESTSTTAELYALAGKYRRDITPRFYWYAGADWLKNELAGTKNRYSGGGGVGYKFLDADRHKLRGELGVSYTKENFVDLQPDGSDSADYAEARGVLGYEFLFREGAKLTSDLSVFENLDDTSDWRGVWASALTASLSERIALKLGYTMLYDNRPAFQLLPDSDPITGGDQVAFHELDDTDTIFTANLVINF